MAVSVYIPTSFRSFTSSQARVAAVGRTVAELIEDLEEHYPGLRGLVYDAQGEVPAHLSVYVNNREISSLQGKGTPVQDGDEVAFIPAIAGGALC